MKKIDEMTVVHKLIKPGRNLLIYCFLLSELD